MEMSTWNFCTNSKLYAPLLPPPGATPLSSPVTADAYARTFRMRRPFFGSTRIPNTIEFHVWHDHIRAMSPPHTPLIPTPSVCKSFHCFALDLPGGFGTGRRRKIFNAISIGFNSHKSQEICKKLNWESSLSLLPLPQSDSLRAGHASSAEAWLFWLRRDLLLPKYLHIN